MSFKCDIALLCELVESKPCLWDKRNPNFKNKIAGERAWEEIYRFLDDAFDMKTTAEKKDIGDKISSKWINVRDAFVRSLRTKSGQAAQKKYVFLLAAQQPSYTESSILVAAQQPSDNESSMLLDEKGSDIAFEVDIAASAAAASSSASNKKSSRKRCSSISEIEKEIMAELKKPKMEEKKCTFFSSFEEYITDMSESEKIQLQMGILSLISRIKANRNNLYM